MADCWLYINPSSLTRNNLRNKKLLAPYGTYYTGIHDIILLRLLLYHTIVAPYLSSFSFGVVNPPFGYYQRKMKRFSTNRFLLLYWTAFAVSFSNYIQGRDGGGVFALAQKPQDEASCAPSASSIPDCQCRRESVQRSVSGFFAPLLEKLTAKYYYVNLERKCPYWHEDGMCVMEACSVCQCDENEIPKQWVVGPTDATTATADASTDKNLEASAADSGWIDHESSSFGFEGLGHDDSLGRLDFQWGGGMYGDIGGGSGKGGGQVDDIADQDETSWARLDDPDKCGREMSSAINGGNGHGRYVNLLRNPERFTGFSGPSAARIWKAVQEENCFGGPEMDDTCLEKRVFNRLMSGLQSSISTHIAKEYFYPNNTWGQNVALFERAVMSVPSRLENMYFAFLFMVRAVSKAAPCLDHFVYDTGDAQEDKEVRELIQLMVNATRYNNNKNDRRYSTASFSSTTSSSSSTTSSSLLSLAVDITAIEIESNQDITSALDECTHGFDESDLFQVTPLPSAFTAYGSSYDASTTDPENNASAEAVDAEKKHKEALRIYHKRLREKAHLKEEFRQKFLNISSIMDCVTCEKCKLWGKLQMAGLGTALKIILTPEEAFQYCELDQCDAAAAAASSSSSSSSSADVGDNEEKLAENDYGAINTLGVAGAGGGGASAEALYLREGRLTKNFSLTRQEIIALINTFNQLTKSIAFASEYIQGKEAAAGE